MNLKLMAAISSFVVIVAGCSSGSPNADSASAISGVVATGKPLVGVAVTVTDSNGKTTKSEPTSAIGTYSVSIANMQAPFVLTAPFTEIDGSAGTLSSLTTASGSVRANLTPITSLIAQQAIAKILDGAPAANDVKSVTESKIQVATKVVTSTLGAALFTNLQVPVSATTDPIGDRTYMADSVNKMDALLDVVNIHVHSGTVSSGVAGGDVVTITPTKVDGTKAAKLADNADKLNKGATTTPITNVIVVIGENHTFDSLFATYEPLDKSQIVSNLLSQGIVKADGTPGANFAHAQQKQAAPSSVYTLDLTRTSAYNFLPQPTDIGILNPDLTFRKGDPDNRFPTTLANGPFQITKYANYTDPVGDPMHRFFQMWQQTGGDNSRLDLHTWVAVNTGQGGDTTGITETHTGQGGEIMGFRNMQQSGEAQVFKTLADNYAMSDNYHQPIMGGTSMNFFSIATGDLPYFNTNGTVATPFSNQITNPNPKAGTSNFYTRDGYQGGSYVNCADASQPGVAAILAKIASFGRKSNCEAGKYYLVNNYEPGYNFLTKTNNPIATDKFNYPMQSVPTIGEALEAKGVSWSWYTGGAEQNDVINVVTGDRNKAPGSAGTPLNEVIISDAAFYATYGAQPSQVQAAQYNTAGNPMVASSKVIADAKVLAKLKGLYSFDNDVKNGTLPAVSFVVPKSLSSGHPGYSATPAYEAFVSDLVTKVKASPQWANTVILITTDEGGGYFDSGYIHNLDFFGDGPRVPMLVVSPYARTGHIDHVYHDHSSILKFIERNWRMKPLSARSRDNLHNPVATSAAPYKPINGAAIGDLMTMLDFNKTVPKK